MIDNIRHLFVGITIAVWAFLKPIEGDLLSLTIVFFLNFFFGYLSGLIANREDFEIKKALRCDSKESVNYYDRDGNVYHYMMVEDYLPDYVNEKTGEHINGFECYIDENGFFCHISDSKVLSRVENSVDTYEDESGNKYYDISTVSWDENGNMIHSNFVTG